MVDRIQVTGPRAKELALREDLKSLANIEIASISEQTRQTDPLTQTRQIEFIDLIIAFSLNVAASVSVEIAKAALLPVLKKHGFRQTATKAHAQLDNLDADT